MRGRRAACEALRVAAAASPESTRALGKERVGGRGFLQQVMIEVIGQLGDRSSVGVMCHRYPPLSLSFIRVTLGSGASPARFVAVLQFVGSSLLEPFVRLLVVAAAAARCCCGLRLF